MNYERYPYGKYKGIYRIESARYEKWDYSNTAIYYVTFCTWNRLPVLARFVDGKLEKNELGVKCEEFIKRLPISFPNCSVDEYVIMPDHVHIIIVINYRGKVSLGNLVNFIKGNTTRYYNDYKKGVVVRIWQERFHDRIIRDQEELHVTRFYIRNNPNRHLAS